MKHVQRRELLDYVTWSERREALRDRILAVKRLRRVHVGEFLTVLFENADTIRYQIQEMMRVERIVRESDIAHELATYNELLGGEGELGCTLLVEIEDPASRAEKLRRWTDLPASLFVRLDDGGRIRARVAEGQQSDGRLSSVQYLKFDTGGSIPVSVGTDHPELETETQLTPEQRAALHEDLAS
jgi:hypothetical protein